MAEKKNAVEATVRSVRRATRKKYSAKEKMRIILEGLGGEHDRRVEPEGRDPTQPVLQMELGISGSGETAPDRGHPASGRQPGSGGDAQ